jgi:hypothetical protein
MRFEVLHAVTDSYYLTGCDAMKCRTYSSEAVVNSNLNAWHYIPHRRQESSYITFIQNLNTGNPIYP